MKFLIIFFSIALVCSLSSASSSSSSSSSSSESSSSSFSSSESSSHESTHSRSKVKCSYTLWIGDDVDREYSIQLKSKPGVSFIDVMEQAATKSNRFKFEQISHQTYGQLINEICGVANNNKTGECWILYDLTSKPDVYEKPCGKLQAPVGVSELKITKYHYYLFWYQMNGAHGQCIKSPLSTQPIHNVTVPVSYSYPVSVTSHLNKFCKIETIKTNHLHN